MGYDQVTALPAETTDVARASRDMLGRVVRWLAGYAGVDQFLDLGAGLPAAESTHEVARRCNPDSTVVYVDNDPRVVSHGRVLLADDEQAFFCSGDLTLPGEVLGSTRVAEHLDLTRPVAVLQFLTLHRIDLVEAQRVMAVYADRLPSGSFIALTHPQFPDRTVDEIATLFAGYELVEPGLVVASDWWPGGPRLTPLPAAARRVLGGVARKP